MCQLKANNLNEHPTQSNRIFKGRSITLLPQTYGFWFMPQKFLLQVQKSHKKVALDEAPLK